MVVNVTIELSLAQNNIVMQSHREEGHVEEECTLIQHDRIKNKTIRDSKMELLILSPTSPNQDLITVLSLPEIE